MGVALYIKSFPKSDSIVLTELKSIGFYDVDGDVIEEYKSDEIVVHDFEVLEVLTTQGALSNFDGIFLPLRDLGFYVFAIDNMNGFGSTYDNQHEYSIAHDPKNIIGAVKVMIKMIKVWDNDVHGSIDIDSNRDALLLIEQFLQDSIQRGDLVVFVIG